MLVTGQLFNGFQDVHKNIFGFFLKSIHHLHNISAQIKLDNNLMGRLKLGQQQSHQTFY